MPEKLKWVGTSAVLVVEFAAPGAFVYEQLRSLGAVDDTDVRQNEHSVGGLSAYVQFDGNRNVTATDQRISVQHAGDSTTEPTEVKSRGDWVLRATRAVLPQARNFNVTALGFNWSYVMLDETVSIARFFQDLPAEVRPLAAALGTTVIDGLPLSISVNGAAAGITIECNLHITRAQDSQNLNWAYAALDRAGEYRSQVEEVLSELISTRI